MSPGQPLRPKDFTLVKKDGYYHLFFILHSTALVNDLNEVEFGHAISPDLYHWTQLPPVLHVDSSGWDNLHVWAPHIVFRNGQYWMFYTGVSRIPGHFNDTQRMGLAVSTDLMTWTRVGNRPIFEGSSVPWAWSDSTKNTPAFRDPFVMPDPQNPGSWLMYYSASYGPDSTAMVVGVARSNGDFSSWTDAGPLLITWQAYTFNPVTESPHLFFHDGLWYLFITTNSGQPLTFYTSPNPVGTPSEWTYRGRLRNMIGFDTSAWYASECVVDGKYDLFAFVAGDRVEMRQIQWSSSWTFTLLQPQFFHVVSMNWDLPTVREDSTASLHLVTANYFAGPPVLQPYLVDSLGVETPVAAESLAFEPSPVLQSDSSLVDWQAVRWPRRSWTDSLSATKLRVRTADSTAASDVLTIRSPVPPHLEILGLTWLEDSLKSGTTAHLKLLTKNWDRGTPGLRTWVIDGQGVETEVPPESLGFEAHPALSSDSTVVTWAAKRWPADVDTDRVAVTRVKVRSTDGTIASGPLVVKAGDVQLTGLAWASTPVRSGESAGLIVKSKRSRASLPTLRTWVVSGAGAETEVAPESLGVQSHPSLNADSVVVSFVMRRWPTVPDTDSVTVTRVIVRSADSLVTSGVLTVRPPVPVVGVRALGWFEGTVKSGKTAHLLVKTRNWFAGTPTLRTWVAIGVGAEVEVPPSVLGFTAHPVLGSDSTVVTWTALRWPTDDDTDRTTQTRVIVTSGDQTAASGELIVTAGDFEVTSLAWASTPVRSGDTTSLVIHSKHQGAGTLTLRTWLVNDVGAETEVPPESLGIAAHPPLAGDSVSMAWVARRWPAVSDTDTVTVTRVIVRTGDALVSSGTLTVRSPAPVLAVRALGWAEPAVTSGESAHLVIRTRNWFAGSPSLRVFLVDSVGAESEIEPATIGLVSQPVLASDSTAVTWSARRWPADEDSDRVSVTRVRVRTADLTVSSGVLTVGPGKVDVTSLAWTSTPVRSGQGLGLLIKSKRPLAGPPALRAWVVSGAGAETEVPPESVGVQSHPPLASDSVVFSLIARRYPAVPDTDSVTVTRVKVRTADLLVASGLLTVQPPLPVVAVRALGWSESSVKSGQSAHLLVRTRNWFAGPAGLRTWLVDGQGAETEVPPESLGIASSLVPASDSTVVTWTARRWPVDHDDDRTTVTRIVVRNADASVSAAVLTVLPADLVVTSLTWAATPVKSGQTVSLVVHSQHPLAGSPSLRAWTVSALGAETEVVPESLGLASHPALTSEPALISWIARRWPAIPDTDSVTVTRVIVRTSDLAHATPLLTINPPLPVVAIRTLSWYETTVKSGNQAHLTIRTRNWFAGPPLLRAWTVSGTGTETEVVPESLGLASHPALASDLTLASWTVRRWPVVGDADRTTITRVIVRNEDKSVSSPLLTIQPPDLQVTALDWLQTSTHTGETAKYYVRAIHPLAGTPSLMAWVINASGDATPVPPESLGISSHPSLTSDSTAITWTARRWPTVPNSDTVTVTRVVLGTIDELITSNEMVVHGPAQTPVAGVDDGVPRPLALRVLGSRIGGAVALSVQLPAPGFVRVDLHDLLGRRVRTLAEAEFPAGETVLSIGNRDGDGGRLANGIYFARLRTGGRTLGARVLLLDR
jgi:hypothetical protein